MRTLLHLLNRTFLRHATCLTLGLTICIGVPQGLAASFADDEWRPEEPKSPAEWFGQTIRESAWRSPQDELRGFHVPQGFRVELVASEPTIAKPMNLAFDAQGRLWVTQSVQYPFPAKEGESAGDAVMILEDKDHDGSFETSHRFADGLNIPIGVLPYQDGCFVFSIPNIYRLRDTDGDGVCDRRDVVVGPFDTTRDTHGMVNALRDGGDGWIYACHGFNNISKLRGSDGHTIELTSGNTFRFRPDGSRVEQYTQGQVNPFGMTRDDYGNWFTADCHSKPITQLLRGACYPSFGRPDDGLGFVPPMMEHLHGSTAISGIECARQGLYPDAFRGDLFCGNVMTCRINRNHVVYQGATAKAVEQPDLLTSDDPWFRPVDLQFGPDGALYVADFYNKIIGHYEVPLDHPDRDRTSGRIWRIVWEESDLGAASPKSIRKKVVSRDPQSMDEAATRLRAEYDASSTSQSLDRLRTVQWIGDHGDTSMVGLLIASEKRTDASRDPILNQAHWIAMRDILRRSAEKEEPVARDLLANAIAQGNVQDLVKVFKAIRHPMASAWTMDAVEEVAKDNPKAWELPWVRETILQVATTTNEKDIPRLMSLLERATPDASSRAEQIILIAEAQKARNGRLSPKLVELGEEVLKDAIQSAKPLFGETVMHTWLARGDKNRDDRPWPSEMRMLDRGNGAPAESVSVLSSIGLSERYTGTWTSSPFVAPESLSFWIVGHNGQPGEPDSQHNFVRILKQNETTRDWQETVRVFPPRSDIGKKVTLDLSGHRGASIRLQVVDGDGHDAYAWIAVDDFSEPGLARGPMRDAFERVLRVAQCFGPSIAAKGGDSDLMVNVWNPWVASPNLDASCKVALQRAVFGNEFPVVSELVDSVVARGWEDLLETTPVIKHANGAEQSLPAYTWAWGRLDAATVFWVAEQYCRRANAVQQEELAQRWMRHRASVSLLEPLMRRGALSKEVLRTYPAAWWESLSNEDAARLADLKPEGESDVARAQVVQAKAAAVQSITPDLKVGARVYQERCAACHQLAGQGKVIGPQLDGAITRTTDRLCEDILWPNRNVDEAFRITNVLTQGGETISGLVIDRRDDTIEIVDQTGKSQRVARDEIEAEKLSKLSLMPGNFEELISDADLASLLGFLKSHTPKP